ncbi:serine/threonine-protein kinase [Rhodopirellula sp. MGV]|uniref:serine/threonine-protein kinase n=1 Tax=Rhodopirellula sp. MGV TaxID=2023130 RepID=UPI000B96DD5F|nr:serine/threonine-protein kinase [Rhodopirellula sp. MGV]OYP31042.1 hypothetical protein CGZ80_21975 [Rhodopirellula sp. MGV]PNY34611.1 serine/threonine protein kinase [Rhodopirellula baltica]
MNEHLICPDNRIDSFLGDQMTDPELLAFEKHLETCAVCRAKLDESSAVIPFWDDAKEFLSDTEITDPQTIDLQSADRHSGVREPVVPRVGQGREVVGLLDPTDHPDMLGRFAGYEVSGIIGRGGMGIVMKARDMSLDRLVAIKILDPSYSSLSASRKRFAREAKSAAAVVHENVIGIYGVDQWNGVPYLVMPYIKGESLQQRIDRHAPLPLEEMLEIAVQIARGLAAAHGQGVIHRDIKPSNILLLNGVSRVLITDFGLARTVDDASLTRSGILAGTPQYMSPEQAMSEAVDRRTDLFSLGGVMYAMACGYPPFRSESPYGVLKKIIDQPHRSLLQQRPDLPNWYVATIDRLLAKQPGQRFASAAQTAALLEDGLAHLRQPASVKHPRIELKRGRKFVLQRRQIAAIAICIAILTAFAASTFWNHTESNTSESNSQPTEQIDPMSPDPDLSWEYDDHELIELENELDMLLQDTTE